METNLMISTLELIALPDGETTSPLLFELRNPFQPESEPIQLELNESHACYCEYTEADFPDHFEHGTPLEIEVKTTSGISLYLDSNFFIPPGETLRLEIPVVLPPEEEEEATPPLLREEARYLIQRALEDHLDAETAESAEDWIDQQMGVFNLLDGLSDAVLNGDPEAMEQMQSLLLDLGDEHAEDPFAFETDLRNAILQVEESNIFNPPPAPDPEFWPRNVLNGGRLTNLLHAAYRTGITHSPEKAMAQLSKAMCHLKPVMQLQLMYDFSVEAYEGNVGPIYNMAKSRVIPRPKLGPGGYDPRGYSGLPNDGGSPRPPRGPRDEPIPPKGSFKPKVWPPRTKKKPLPLDDFYKRCFWTVERYFCTMDLLRQTPFDPPQTYSLTSITGNGIVCKGESVTILGSGFGTTGNLILGRGASQIYLPTIFWSDTQIDFVVPQNAKSGRLNIQIVYDTKTICGTIRPFYKAGPGTSLRVLSLQASLDIQRTGLFATAKGKKVDLFRIAQTGVIIRNDQAKINWSTQDALDGAALKMTDPNGQVSTLSNDPRGNWDFPGSAVAQDGLHQFQLESSNKCRNENLQVEADMVLGTKARINSFTLDGNAANWQELPSQQKANLAWSVVDASLIRLRIEDRLLGNKSSSKTSTVAANDTANPILGNAYLTLEAIGTIRKGQRLVTDLKRIKVAAKPIIVQFEADRTVVSHGNEVHFRYQIRNATQAILKRSNGSDIELKQENGVIKVQMNNSTALEEIFSLELRNSMYPASHSNRVLNSQPLTIRYRPSFEKFELVPANVSLNDGRQSMPQFTKPDINIKLCYNTSQYNNTGLHTPQLFSVNAKVNNAKGSVRISMVWKSGRVVQSFNRIPTGFKPAIDDIITVTATASNGVETVKKAGTATYKKGLLNYFFCVRLKSIPGGPRNQGSKTYALGWSEEEAKKVVQARLGSKSKDFTVTSVAWNGNCL